MREDQECYSSLGHVDHWPRYPDTALGGIIVVLLVPTGVLPENTIQGLLSGPMISLLWRTTSFYLVLCVLNITLKPLGGVTQGLGAQSYQNEDDIYWGGSKEIHFWSTLNLIILAFIWRPAIGNWEAGGFLQLYLLMSKYSSVLVHTRNSSSALCGCAACTSYIEGHQQNVPGIGRKEEIICYFLLQRC